jgi:hypothetical protein
MNRTYTPPQTSKLDGTHIPGSGTAVTAVCPAKIDSPEIVLIAAELTVKVPLE